MPKHSDPSVRTHFHEGALSGARLKAIGIGGGGSNAINRMIEVGIEGVEFISVNTDLQSLRSSHASTRLQIGARLTHGLGAGASLEIGRRAAVEESGKIIEALEGADMVFIIAGLGGGTGTGAAPVIASIAGEMGLLTVAIVTRPFTFEGKRRMSQADRGLQELLDRADAVIVIPNQKLLECEQDTGFLESFQIIDDVLRHAVQGISDIITIPGVINRGFADVRMTMAGMGYAVMGRASRTGPRRAAEAALAAITSPMLEARAMDGARSILINITGSSSLKLSEVNDASTIIKTAAHDDANIIFGAVLNERLCDEIEITVIATGFPQPDCERVERRFLILDSTEEPTASFEIETQRQRDLPIEAHDVTAQQPHAKRSESETPDLVTGHAEVGDLQSATAHIQPADDADRQEASDIYIDSSAPTEVPRFVLEADRAPNEASSADILTMDDEQDLLANIDGPPFNWDFMGDEPVPPQTPLPTIHPEILRIRQAAIAAYSAIAAPHAENEALPVRGEATFSEILESRRKALEADDLLDEEELPQQEPTVLTSGQEYMEDREKGESPSHADVVRPQQPPADEVTEPPTSSDSFFAPSLNGATPSHFIASIAPTDLATAQAVKMDTAKISTPDFNRRLHREPDFSMGVEVI